MKSTAELVLVRHAQSEYNAQERFTGWANPALTDYGEEEARRAAEILTEAGYKDFDYAFTSRLVRAADTAKIILNSLPLGSAIKLEADWRLNERHYGDLQGRKRVDMIAKVGEEQVWRWRRSYEEKPPLLAENDVRHPKHDKLYADVNAALLPSAESLRDTRRRVVKFYNEKVLPRSNAGQRVLIVAHGNSLRGLLMELSEMSIAEVEAFEVPTGIPIVCTRTEDQNLEWRYLEKRVA